ncbi:hypothetical protein ABFW00_15560 [Mycobacteroides abscessus]|uniref:hypothetical protein n=1 Tax=Mycobacteroides abscessus TaxID=36809 RepID=UPI0034CD80DC
MSDAEDTFTLDWHPASADEPYTWVDEEGPHEANVIGMMAYLPDGRRFYEIWPVDRTGTSDDGWALRLDDDGDIEHIGTFGSYGEATEAADRHLENVAS